LGEQGLSRFKSTELFSKIGAATPPVRNNHVFLGSSASLPQIKTFTSEVGTRALNLGRHQMGVRGSGNVTPLGLGGESDVTTVKYNAKGPLPPIL
jgi:hypothetical protein